MEKAKKNVRLSMLSAGLGVKLAVLKQHMLDKNWLVRTDAGEGVGDCAPEGMFEDYIYQRTDGEIVDAVGICADKHYAAVRSMLEDGIFADMTMNGLVFVAEIASMLDIKSKDMMSVLGKQDIVRCRRYGGTKCIRYSKGAGCMNDMAVVTSTGKLMFTLKGTLDVMSMFGRTYKSSVTITAGDGSSVVAGTGMTMKALARHIGMDQKSMIRLLRTNGWCQYGETGGWAEGPTIAGLGYSRIEQGLAGTKFVWTVPGIDAVVRFVKSATS